MLTTTAAVVSIGVATMAARPLEGQEAPPAVRAELDPEVTALRAAMALTFEGYPWGRAQWSALVVSLDTGDTLFAIEPHVPRAPASNAKLLTSAAALHVLGPDYRYRTWLLSDSPVRNGVLEGDLTLYGTGDPGISDRFYRRKDDVFQGLIDDLERTGVHTVAGDIVADASFFPGPLRGDGWETRDLNEHFAAAVSALSYNENVVSFRIRPGLLGEVPIVETVPPHSALEVINTAETVVGRARPRLAILRDDPLAPVRIDGRLESTSKDVWRQMTVAVPADFAGASFRAALEERGISVLGRTRSIDLPANSVMGRLSAPALGRPGARVLARHVSRPLVDYLMVVNKESNNLFAELIFRATGRAMGGIGSVDASSYAVRATLGRIGVDTTGIVLVDGSGLSEENRVSATSFVQIIAGMSGGPLWDEFWATLPRAGTPRELGRMYRTAAAGNLRAKTGTIDGVSALSGMVRSSDGERIAFSLLVNNSPSQTRAKQVENLVGARLAEFRREPERARALLAAVTPDAVSGATAFHDRHRVSRGENLTTIATQYGVTVGEILSANPRMEPNRIVVGQWIDLPQRPGSD